MRDPPHETCRRFAGHLDDAEGSSVVRGRGSATAPSVRRFSFVPSVDPYLGGMLLLTAFSC
jgi:hypothetical protein